MSLLVACEESQAVTLAFRNYGIKAFSCDIQDCSGGHPEWHIKDDVLNIIDYDWDMIIAHPPCTYLTVCGNRSYFTGFDCINWQRVIKGLKAKSFFMKFYNNKCSRICIENPLPLSYFNLPKYTQIIQPYNFGHFYSKRTCLWLKNLPPLFNTCMVDKYTSYTDSVHGSVLRSKTFPGIALAMANQWRYFAE